MVVPLTQDTRILQNFQGSRSFIPDITGLKPFLWMELVHTSTIFDQKLRFQLITSHHLTLLPRHLLVHRPHGRAQAHRTSQEGVLNSAKDESTTLAPGPNILGSWALPRVTKPRNHMIRDWHIKYMFTRVFCDRIIRPIEAGYRCARPVTCHHSNRHVGYLHP